MNYIGSKYSLLEAINSVLEKNNVPKSGIAVDVFAGTTTVGQYLKNRGHSVVSNDWQYYSFVTGVAFLKFDEMPSFSTLLAHPEWQAKILNKSNKKSAQQSLFSSEEETPITVHSALQRTEVSSGLPAVKVLKYLEALPGTEGTFFHEYCEGGKAGRLYYSDENGRLIQQIRDQIEEWSISALIDQDERSWLVACLVESADRIANTASVYGAYLKNVKKIARKRLQLVALLPIPSQKGANGHKVLCEDAGKLFAKANIQRATLAYLDPPYNHRQYSANYHVLETIARWDFDQFTPRGTTGLRNNDEQTSVYCSRRHAHQGFKDLFHSLNSDYVLFSYNNEGLLSEDQLNEIFAECCEWVNFEKIQYNRFRADSDGENRTYKADETHEFLILGKIRSAQVTGLAA